MGIREDTDVIPYLLALLAALAAFAPRHDETADERADRLAKYAYAAARTPLPEDVLAVILAESGAGPEAHKGTKRGDGGRSYCGGQISKGNPVVSDHEALVGTSLEATERCVDAVSRSLLRARGWCRGQGFTGPEAMHALYATGKSCEWSGAAARVRLANAIRQRTAKARRAR